MDGYTQNTWTDIHNTWTDIHKMLLYVDFVLYCVHIYDKILVVERCNMRDDLKLKQSNNLILATHRMNINQMRLFFYACSQYRGDLEVNASINDVNKVLSEDSGNRGGHQREIIRETIPTLMSNALVHIDDENGERWSVAITDSYVSKNDDTVHFTFNKSIQKELEELRGYTWMYLSNLTGMASTYSVRLYEFFAMRLGTQNMSGTFDYDLNKLRLYLDCTNKYKDFRDFNKRILLQAEKEINEKTNIRMSYAKKKTGRSVTSIKFTFKWKSKDDVIDVEHTVYDPNEPPEGQTTIDDYLGESEEVFEMLKKYD